MANQEKLDLEPLDLEPIEDTKLDIEPYEEEEASFLDKVLAPLNAKLGTDLTAENLKDVPQGAANALFAPDTIQGVGIPLAAEAVDTITGQDKPNLELQSKLIKQQEEYNKKRQEKGLAPEKVQFEGNDVVETNPLKDLFNKYRSAKNIAKESREEAEARSPKTILATSLIAGLPIAGGMTAASKALPALGTFLPKVNTSADLAAKGVGRFGDMIRQGGKAGALAGLDIGPDIEKDAYGAVKSQALSTAMGAGLGGTLGAVNTIAGKAAKTDTVKGLVDSFKRGTDKQTLDDTEVRNRLSEAASDYIMPIASEQKNLGSKIGQYIDDATRAGTVVDTTAELSNFMNRVNSLTSETPAIQQLKSYATSLANNPDKYNALSPRQLKDLMGTINSEGKTAASSGNNQIASMYNKLESDLKEKLKQSLPPEYSEVMKRFSDIEAGQNMLGLQDLTMAATKENQVLLPATLASKLMSSSNKQAMVAPKALEFLGKGGEELMEQAKMAAIQLSSPNFIGSSAKPQYLLVRNMNRIANGLGQGYAATVGELGNFVNNITPDGVKNIATVLSGINEFGPFKTSLEKIAASPDIKKQQVLLYSLLQQPAFKSLLNSTDKKQEELNIEGSNEAN